MIQFATLACGNCVYYAMWHRFPPISSWIVIIPVWFLFLSAIRTFSTNTISAVPTLHVAVPLVIAVFFFAPGMIGPPLGFWIPVCCVVGTFAGLIKNDSASVKRQLMATSALAVTALIAFGLRDYHLYNQMPTAEKEKFIPDWEATPERKLTTD